MKSSESFFRHSSVLLLLLVLATPIIQGCGGTLPSTLQSENLENMDAEAAYQLGMKYGIGGDGLERDDAKAFDLIRKAAQKGHLKATYALGWIYLDGRGTPAEPVSAAGFFTAAAEQGDADSQYMLFVLYSQGRGVEKDTNVAFQWLNKAIANGHPEAKRTFGSMFRSTPMETPEKK